MRLRVAGLLVVQLAMVAAWASPAAAQMPIYPPYYPSPYPYAYPYRYAGPEADIRLNVKPKNAMVFVDGYYAGQVDDFDGVFQRLHITPGNHDIVIYLQGYHSLRQKLYAGPNTSRKITARLEPLAAGEPNEPMPVPAEPPPGAEPRRPAPPPQRGGPGRYPPPPPGRGPDARRPQEPPGGQPAPTVGTVVIRVQPVADDIRIDGEHWDAPSRPDDRLVVQLTEGHHVIEVSKSGYRPARTELDVHAGETTPVNISLATDLTPVR